MKGKWTALVMAMAMVFLAVTAGLAAKVLFEDKFTAMDSGWGAPSNIVYVKDGKFIISPDVGTSLIRINQSFILPDDMDASVTMNFQKMGDGTMAPGILFWVKSAEEYYAFMVAPSGYFAVQRKVPDRYLWPVNWQKSDTIKSGEGVDNILRVVTKGTQGTVYINGQQVATFSGQPPAGGSQIGLGASSGAKAQNVVALSNLTVVQP